MKKDMKKRIKALRYFEIHTRVDYAELGEGEVAEVEFASEREFKAHLQCGMFIETKEPITEYIPVFPSEADYEIYSIDKDEDDVEVVEPVFDNTEDKQENTLNFDELDDEDKQALLERENAKGRPYKCLNVGCGRLRKKENLFCKVCQND